jgi:poly-gamma-glutamate capsule biosynthesis protein CapA/YwtB (metallophosphatase superfamily)
LLRALGVVAAIVAVATAACGGGAGGAAVVFHTPSPEAVAEATQARGPRATPSPQAEAPSGVVRIAAGGDVMLARSVGARILRDGPEVAFAGVADVLREADLAVVNLECAVAAGGTPAAKGYTFRAPPVAAAALAAAGIDVVALANNHSLDYGPDALLETLEHLSAHGIGAAGAGGDGAAARAPFVVEKNGLRIAFLSYVETPAEGAYNRSNWEAGPAKAGVAWLDVEHVVADVAAARRAADAVVVFMHFGFEYHGTPSEAQRRQARAAIDAGASLVLGSHPHVLQEAEEYNGGLIAYSLGNFVFDGFDPPANDSAILLVELTKNGVGRYEFVPVTIVDGLPRLT